MGSQRSIKNEMNEENEEFMDVKPSTAAKDLSTDLDEDFPISQPSEIKPQPIGSEKLRRNFIASAKNAKPVLEIKTDTHSYLPQLLRKNWRKANTSKNVQTKKAARKAFHCSTSNSSPCPSKKSRNDA